ncbi:MAG: Hsp20/alpha crystallin family protein [Deltaproteobacteria bacterium]|nr:Hsp20/alpha crystallin family protein [Deltaproteobacteria bacterium]
MNSLSILTPRNWIRRTEPDLNRFSGLDRLFDVLLDGLSLSGRDAQTESKSTLVPRLDIHKEDHQYSINVEIPGVEEKDMRIEVKGNELAISGEKRYARETQGKGGSSPANYYSERSYGSFTRVVTLPEDVDSNAIAANYKNGVLTLLLPRREPEKSKSRTISVTNV